MRIAYLGFLLAAACGRIGFDGITDDPDGGTPAPDLAPCTNGTNHDEDRDGIDDACDLCPHIADSGQENFDRDGLGDACDWDVFREEVLFFDPFTSMRPEWTFSTGVSVVTDQLQLSSSGTAVFASLSDPPGLERIEIEGELVTVDDGAHQLAIRTVDLAGDGSYFCELYDDGNTGKIGLTYTYDEIDYTIVDAMLVGRIDPGPVKITLVNVRPNIQCIVEYAGQRIQVGGFVPNNLPGDAFLINTYAVDARIDYAIRITAN